MLATSAIANFAGDDGGERVESLEESEELVDSMDRSEVEVKWPTAFHIRQLPVCKCP